MAINNPLIDDYTLKGAKGLLINITCGDDLKLFEVDEVINKIRAEVDSEAEVITGAITDTTLDGKIRVSIVATALDGQQPESKSVINMVHRIQNRNPGYSDFSVTGSAQSFNFTPTMSSPITHGANALKLENEITTEPVTNTTSSEMMNEQTISNHEVESNSSNEHEQSFSEDVLSNTNKTEENNLEVEHSSNGLENFGVEGESSPDLFSSDDDITHTEGLLSEEINENITEDDDLEIPAFLRRQKN
jgi:cell division protein FtsZ